MDLKPLMQLSYGMYVVGADDNGKPAGFIVNTISQNTSENPILALSMNKNNYTHDVILNSGKFSVSILSEQTDPTVISYMGFSSGRDTNKFEQVAYRMVEDMPVLTDHISGAFLCKVVGSYEVETLLDNWTVVTLDGKLAAHYENSVVITDGEPELLTL